jgi:hypothetical protein
LLIVSAVTLASGGICQIAFGIDKVAICGKSQNGQSTHDQQKSIQSKFIDASTASRVP